VPIDEHTDAGLGLDDGYVIDISPDVATDDKRPTAAAGGDAADARSAKSDHEASGSPSYMARIALAGTSMQADGRTEPLRPGMAVTAEIKTGSRRILEYLLSPPRQYSQEAIRER
jgi:hemolysin D